MHSHTDAKAEAEAEDVRFIAGKGSFSFMGGKFKWRMGRVQLYRHGAG
jgi:hypothetical protein